MLACACAVLNSVLLCLLCSLPDGWTDEEKCLVPQSLQRHTRLPVSVPVPSPRLGLPQITQHVEGS